MDEDKKSVKYFMESMTQEEFNVIINLKTPEKHEFNVIRYRCLSCGKPKKSSGKLSVMCDC